MIICKVKNCITSTAKDEKLVGFKLLVVQPANVSEEESFVAVDTVGAGIGDLVLVVIGSAARESAKTQSVPTDASIVAIIDPYQIPAEPGEVTRRKPKS